MKIYVNDKNIDFTLESEEKIGDVIRGLEKWVAQNDNVIKAIKINNVDFNLENLNRDNNMRIEDIETVKIVTANKIDLAFDTLETINEYRINILKILESGVDAVIKRNDEIMEGVELILEGLRLSLRIMNVNPLVIIIKNKERFENILVKLEEIKNEYERKYLDEEGIDTLKVIMLNTKEYLIKIYKWGVVKNLKKVKIGKLEHIPFIDEILNDLLIVCKDAEKMFEEIGTSIQIGEDLKAFNGIYYITGIMEEIIDVFHIVKNIIFKDNIDILEKFETEKIFEDITNNLKEVEESFRNEDLVTIADIMEYELMPLFKKLMKLIDKVDNFIRIN